MWLYDDAFYKCASNMLLSPWLYLLVRVSLISSKIRAIVVEVLMECFVKRMKHNTIFRHLANVSSVHDIYIFINKFKFLASILCRSSRWNRMAYMNISPLKTLIH